MYADDGKTVLTEMHDILNRWGRDFESLFIPPLMTDEGQAYVNDIKNQISMDEERLKYTPQHIYNDIITHKEVHKAIHKAKNNKAAGLDSLTYEVLKNEISATTLTKLFNYCFDSGMVPDAWTKGLINPIPKSANTDLRVPVN